MNERGILVFSMSVKQEINSMITWLKKKLDTEIVDANIYFKLMKIYRTVWWINLSFPYIFQRAGEGHKCTRFAEPSN